MSKEKASRNDEKIGGCSNYWTIFGFIVLLTLVTRFYKVTDPDHVCWDETHFGKMGSWYINRTFFFDVHPPLGKMLIGLSGALTGYNGTYPFEKPGDKYNGTAYEGMRIFCTTLGAMIVPMSYDTVHEMTGSVHAALISASYILFDVGLITLNQYILLDPILLFFMTASVWGMVKVRKCTLANHSFQLNWWLWLFFTGTMLAGTISVKFVGLFVVLLAGLYTVDDLWTELGDMAKPVLSTIKQLLSRALTLIAWPILLYLIFFYVHLTVLNRTGNGDGFYSSAFQSRLIGNSLHNASMPREVAFGAVITLKNHKTGGGYLHSHSHLYPEGFGAKQQQITTYTHKDQNNRFVVKPYNKEVAVDGEVEFLKNGQLLRLEHKQTTRNLHSHQELAPVTKKHYQVTGYGENGKGDSNDIWKVVVPGLADNETILTVTTRFMLVHYLQNCALTTSGKQLPKWAYDQQEVSCNPNIRDKNAFWNVEENVYEKLPNVSFQVYAPGFLERFFESHFVMFQGNAGLKPKEGEITSKPWQWPINFKGQFFSGANHRIYLLGNPVIWWSNLIFLALFVLLYCVDAIKGQRAKAKLSEDLEKDSNSSEGKTTKADENKSLSAGAWLFVGWLLHYLPFWAMGRVLYFHHYFPALIFSSMLSGIILEYMIRRLSPFFKQIVLTGIIGILVYSFVLFSPLAYGMSGPSANEKNSTLYGLRWLDSWEF